MIELPDRNKLLKFMKSEFEKPYETKYNLLGLCNCCNEMTNNYLYSYQLKNSLMGEFMEISSLINDEKLFFFDCCAKYRKNRAVICQMMINGVSKLTIAEYVDKVREGKI